MAATEDGLADKMLMWQPCWINKGRPRRSDTRRTKERDTEDTNGQGMVRRHLTTLWQPLMRMNGGQRRASRVNDNDSALTRGGDRVSLCPSDADGGFGGDHWRSSARDDGQ